MNREKEIYEELAKRYKNKEFPRRVALLQNIYHFDGDPQGFIDQLSKGYGLNIFDSKIIKIGKYYYFNNDEMMLKLRKGLYTYHGFFGLTEFHRRDFSEWGLEGVNFKILKNESI